MNKNELQSHITGIVLFNPNYLNYVNIATSLHLFNDPYKTILEAVLFMGPSNARDLVKLVDYLRITGKLDPIGGEEFLIGLQSEIPDNTTMKNLTKSLNMMRSMK